jgi:hypothetical protein
MLASIDSSRPIAGQLERIVEWLPTGRSPDEDDRTLLIVAKL